MCDLQWQFLDNILNTGLLLYASHTLVVGSVSSRQY